MKKVMKKLVIALLAVCMAFAVGCGKNPGGPGGPSELVLNSTAVTLEKGETFSLKVADAETLTLAFSSSDETVATVASDGTITAIGAGSATITVSAGELSATCSVTVNEEKIYSLSLDRTSAVLGVGSNMRIEALPTLNGEAHDSTVEWSVTAGGEQTDIVTFVADKNVITITGAKAGEVIVTASANDCSANATVTVAAYAGDYEDADSDQEYILDDNRIAAMLADENTNWAGKKAISLWSSDFGSVFYDTAANATALYYASETYEEEGEEKTRYPKAYLKSDIFEKAVDAGYTHVTVRISGRDYDFWGAIGSGETAIANAAKASPFEKTMPISDRSDGAGKYSLWVTTSGWWMSSHFMCVESVVFSHPIKDIIDGVKDKLSDPATNYATIESLLPLWYGSANVSIDEYGVKLTQTANGGEAAFNSDFIAEAAKAGYDSVSVSFASASESREPWLVVSGANGRLYDARPSAVGAVQSLDIALADIRKSDGTYSLSFAVAGGWSGVYNDFNMVISEVKFGHVIAEKVAAAKAALSDKTTNFATEAYLPLWTATSPIAYDSGANAITVAYDGSASIRSELIAAAVEKGYTHITVKAKAIGFSDFWFKVYSGETMLNALSNYGTEFTGSFELSSLRGTDGNYSLKFSTGGWWKNCFLGISSVTFSNLVEETLAAAKTALGDKTTNFATEAYLPLWTATSEVAYNAAESAITVKYADNAIGTLNGELLKAAVEKGYTHINVKAKGIGYNDLRLSVKNASEEVVNSGATKTYTAVIELSKFKGNSGAYTLGFTSTGWWGGCFIGIESITFSKPAIDIAEGLKDKTTNYASPKYLSCWTATSSLNYNYDESAVTIQYSGSGSLSGELLKAAVEKGYTHITVTAKMITTGAQIYDFWFAISKHAADETALAEAKKATPFTATVALADLREDDGSYSIAFTTGGWGQAYHYIGIESVTFSNPVADAIENGLATEGTNFATGEYLNLWSAATNSISYDSTEMCIKTAHGSELSIDSKLLEAAAEKGYTKMKVTAKAIGGFDFWFSISKHADDETALAEAKKVTPFTATISLADLREDDGSYSVVFSTGGGWSGDHFLGISSVTFEK